MVDFWIPCPAGVETIETGELSIVGWVAGDDDLAWCKALSGVALVLIARKSTLHR